MSHKAHMAKMPKASPPKKQRKIFFARHGYHTGDHVSTEGFAKLAPVRAWLEARDFRAKEGISSPLSRSVETAKYLMYGAEPITLSELNAFNEGWGFVYIKSEASCNKRITPKVATEYVIEMIPKLLIELEEIGKESEENDLVVICHKLVPLQLAWHYLELQGRFRSWDAKDIPLELTFPSPGEGILVQGTEFEFYRHDSVEQTVRSLVKT